MDDGQVWRPDPSTAEDLGEGGGHLLTASLLSPNSPLDVNNLICIMDGPALDEVGDQW